MNKRLFIFLVLVGVANMAWSQKYRLEKSTVTFYSHAAIEDIAAENQKTAAIFEASSGDVAFSVPIKDFEFEKSLMKEHFNEKYMHTEKYPKSTFTGKLVGFDGKATGVQNVTAVGKLSIHGETKDINVPGTVEVSGSKLLMKSKFIVKLADYNIEIPTLLWQNIAEQVEVTLDFTFSQ
jgi:hypothetical protein